MRQRYVKYSACEFPLVEFSRESGSGDPVGLKNRLNTRIVNRFALIVVYKSGVGTVFQGSKLGPRGKLKVASHPKEIGTNGI